MLGSFHRTLLFRSGIIHCREWRHFTFSLPSANVLLDLSSRHHPYTPVERYTPRRPSHSTQSSAPHPTSVVTWSTYSQEVEDEAFGLFAARCPHGSVAALKVFGSSVLTLICGVGDW
ncbi:unnamed protein product [Zymoseptoria tritici ST99CH_3D7]|uniref:Uncharacterized protein n=1 Tax=Zymoseptoria tritici (strain ST99CH_3D7) TaxID=1276538 RepID=A0A1X7RXD9_ZYMT9|nr:unnamed protein product [Zymoseptoria tritici ST99CH_3D7]